jgi:diaminopimelate epimerase
MQLQFSKYHGTGNDFIMIDNRDMLLQRDNIALFSRLCDRHFGIGADGVILLQLCDGVDFEMVYFNADGRESTMCGNGGRCMVAFAIRCGLQQDIFSFKAIDGMHAAFIADDKVHLKMQVATIGERRESAFILDTGSPHYVQFRDAVAGMDVMLEGKAIRHAPEFDAAGINVNFAEVANGGLLVRTFERGVEAETLSCGTGVTAAALSFAGLQSLPEGKHTVPVQTPGGELEVRFTVTGNQAFTDIWLVGPAVAVFDGTITI